MEAKVMFVSFVKRKNFLESINNFNSLPKKKKLTTLTILSLPYNVDPHITATKTEQYSKAKHLHMHIWKKKIMIERYIKECNVSLSIG